MLGIYFSGTGNTKYCVERFVHYYNGSTAISLENPEAIEAIKASKNIIFGYPIYYSNIPKIVKDFMNDNKNILRDKHIFIISTMGLFSGDGAGCGARLLKKHGAAIIGGLHLKMPDCIGDVKLLKKTLEQNRQLVKEAEKKIETAVSSLKAGKPPKDGLNIIHHIAGLFGQRLWFYNKTASYTDKININTNLCVGCGKCSALCPKDNLAQYNGKAAAGSQCTMCYRCINHCPQRAITLLGRQVVEQCTIERYVE